MAPTPFSLPLAHLLVLSTKTVDDKRVKELINKWQTKGDKEESTIILSDRCYRSLGRQQEQKDCSEGDFHCLKTLIHKDRETPEENFFRSLNGNTESLQKFVLSLTIVVLRLFCSLRFILCLKLVTMSGATSDQLHRSTLSVYVVSLFCWFIWILFMLWTRWLDCSISNWSNCCWTVFSGVFVNMYFTLFVCVCVCVLL